MVEYINYEGESLPVRIQYYALMKFKGETGKSFDEMKAVAKKGTDKTAAVELGLDEFEILEPLLYYALVSGHKKINPEKEFTIKRKEAFNILEECFLEFAALLPKFFPTEEDVTGADEPGKKQLTNQTPKKKKRK